MNKSTLAVFFAVFALACSSQAGVVLSDDFESYAIGGNIDTVSAPNAFGSWNVAVGSVDLLSNFTGLTCFSGSQCVDMDGSTLAAGSIFQTVNFTGGLTYTLTFYYSGNQRGGLDTMVVTLGTQSITLTDIASSVPWTQASVQFTPAVDISGNIIFSHGGSDNVGILLDDVVLADNRNGTAPIPEPSTVVLVCAGLACTALLRKRGA